jgi:hypothetical protein
VSVIVVALTIVVIITMSVSLTRTFATAWRPVLRLHSPCVCAWAETAAAAPLLDAVRTTNIMAHLATLASLGQATNSTGVRSVRNFYNASAEYVANTLRSNGVWYVHSGGWGTGAEAGGDAPRKGMCAHVHP